MYKDGHKMHLKMVLSLLRGQFHLTLKEVKTRPFPLSPFFFFLKAKTYNASTLQLLTL